MLSAQQVSTLLILIAAITGNYPKKFRQVTGQKDTIHNIFLSNYPVEIVSTFCADSAHWRFYNNKRLIKHALFIPRVNSNVLAKQIYSLVNSHFWIDERLFCKKKSFFLISGAKADSRYKRIAL